MVKSYLGLSMLGIYAMLFKFVSLIDLFVTGPLLRIWSVKRLEICEEKEGSQQIAEAFTAQFALFLFVGLIVILEIPLLLKFLTPKEFWIPTYFVFLAVYSRLFNFSYYHFVFGLIYSKLTYKISIIQGLTATINLFLMIFLVKYYNIPGALLASFIVYLCQCILAYKFSNKYYYIPFEWKKIFYLTTSNIAIIFSVDYLCTINSFYFIDLSKEIMSFLDQNGSFPVFLHENFRNYSVKIPIIIEFIFRMFSVVLFLLVLIQCKVLNLRTLLSPFKKLAFLHPK
jgi:O-antigen/teichoic acid export membrane protein